MKKQIFNVLKYVFFLGLGVYIFYRIYKKFEFGEILEEISTINLGWIIVSILLGVLSLISRALRWRLLIDSIGYKTKFINVFLSCYVLYLVNLLIPRAGEVARCSVVAGTDKVPFAKLVGTMIVERMADVVMLFILAILIFAYNIPIIKTLIFEDEKIMASLSTYVSAKYILIAVGAIILIVVVLFYLRRKFVDVWKKLMEGVYSISKLERKWEFVGHTAFIFLMWLGMLYVVFWAYAPTAHLSLRIGMLTFLMGGLAMLIPVQGGMGTWHGMVSETLQLFDISEKHGDVFALIAHTATNLIYIILGLIALILLYVLNKGGFNLSGKEK